MAYTQTPTQSTYQTKVIPFAEEWETREQTNAKDVQNINVVWDVVKESLDGDGYVEAIKREGIDIYSANYGAGNPIMGIYTWKGYGDGYVVVVTTNAVFLLNTFTGATIGTAAVSISGLTGIHVGFDEYQYDNGDKRVIFSDGLRTYVYDGVVTATLITDPDFPLLAHLPYPVVLDGYLFISDLKGNIFNSALNDPLTWTAGNSISVESYSDNTLAICRVGQYIAALGNESIQFFYDAANPTGTPLAVQTTVLKVGFMGGLAQHGDDTYFIGQPNGGAPSVYQLTGLKASPVQSLPASRRLITFNNSFLGNIVIFQGRAVYIWREDKDFIGLNQLTYGLDLSSGLWSQFTYGAGGGLNGDMPVSMSCTFRDSNGLRSMMLFKQSTNLYATVVGSYTDQGALYEFTMRTKNLDFGTRRNKFGSRVLLNCDQMMPPAGPQTSVQIYWGVDDYQTFPGTGFSAVDAASEYPVCYGMGLFRKIYFKLQYRGNQAFRVQSLEFDFNLGDA